MPHETSSLGKPSHTTSSGSEGEDQDAALPEAAEVILGPYPGYDGSMKIKGEVTM